MALLKLFKTIRLSTKYQYKNVHKKGWKLMQIFFELIEKIKNIYFNDVWWIWQTILIFISGFFLTVGIEILIKSYKLNNPFYFIMIFFASNLIILISGILMVGFIYRMVGVFKLIHKKKTIQKNNGG